MAAFVLVHGGWHGGWCWEKLAPLLRRAEHRVMAPDLPGHGDDPATPADRPWERYVSSVCDVVDAQPQPVILVGHSSGGVIVTDVAACRPDRVAATVYLAAFLLPNGVAPPAVMADDTESLLRSSVVVDHEQGTSTMLPERVREVFYADCTDADAAWAIARLRPEPLIPRDAAVASPPVVAAGVSPPRFYIETLRDKALGPATQRRMYEALPCRNVYSLATGHSPFLSAPGELAGCLEGVAEVVLGQT